MRSVVQVHLGPPIQDGGVAQLGERLPCTQEVIGSIPFTSTSSEAMRLGTEESAHESEGFLQDAGSEGVHLLHPAVQTIFDN